MLTLMIEKCVIMQSALPSLQEYLGQSVDHLQFESDFAGLKMSIFSKNASMNQNK